MAKTKSFDQMTTEEIRKQLEKAIADADQMSIQALATFAKFQEQRANRLSQGLQQISQDLGEDHPAYAATRLAAERASTMKTLLQSQAERIKSKPVLKPYEWVVFGQVLDTNGKAAPGLTVRVFDRDRKYDDLLGETETDANGDFSVIYHERDFAESRENLPELYVMVSDASGKTLYSSQENVRFEAGKSEYFAIRLGEPPTVDEKKTRRRKK